MTMDIKQLYLKGQAASFEGLLSCLEDRCNKDVTPSNNHTSFEDDSMTRLEMSGGKLQSSVSFRSMSPISRMTESKSTELTRSISCNPSSRSKLLFPSTITDFSQVNDEGLKPERSPRCTRLQRTGSKYRPTSTVCLTQSLSLNLETFRLIRNDSNKSNPRESPNELQTSEKYYGRARPNFGVKKGSLGADSDMYPYDDDCKSETNSVNEITTPKPVRYVKYINGNPVNDFKFSFGEEYIKIPNVYGELKMRFQFINESNELRITLLKGCNIASQSKGTLGIYSKLCLMPGKLQMKCGSDTHDTHEPVFYETFVFKAELGDLLNRELKIKLYNKPGVFSFSRPVGECFVHLYDYDLTSSTVIWQNLKKCKDQRDDLDDFDFTPLERHSIIKRKGIQKWLCGLAGP